MALTTLGLTLSDSVYIGSNSSTLGNIIVGSRAEIYKKLFDGWVDLTALQKNFPSRIEIGESMVSFVGPVAILQSPTIINAAFIATVVFATLYALLVLSNIKLLLKQTPRREKHIITDLIICGVTALIAFYAGSRFCIQPGIYFSNNSR